MIIFTTCVLKKSFVVLNNVGRTSYSNNQSSEGYDNA